MCTKFLFSFIITHPDAGLRFTEMDLGKQPLLDYWQAVGAVFAQMLEQMDDQDLARSLHRRAIAQDGLYQAASDERGLTVLSIAESALVTLLGEELGEETEAEFSHA
jgi:hypothetical protein